MAKIVVDNKNVTLEKGEKAPSICPFGAIEWDGENVSINSACRLCKICVRKEPAIFSFEEDVVEEIDKSKWIGVSVFIEHHDGVIHPVSLELIGKAKELAAVINHPVYAILFTDDVKKYQDELLAYGVDKVYVYENSLLEQFNVEIYTNMMEDFVKRVMPTVILYGGTSIGRSFAPRVAARFKTGLTADCTILDMKENTDLVQNRPAFGGNIMAGILCANTRPQMATVRYKIFKMPEKVKPHGTVEMMDTKGLSFASSMRLLEVKQKPKDIDISEAETIVACGRPFNSQENLKLAEELADLLGAQLAVTRPLVESGIANPKRQIGLSGRTVAPKLLINLGISGAVQFTAGMTGSEVVFSICDDKNAPIFDVSHYGLVGDVFEILPKLIEDIKSLKGLN
ncbi:MAG: electron transfer flavoprotein subunit alpha/FixB family protein [Bacilli bacterium]|nr:electron transfer flavoprotein subunit alpha/FixB family protein [Bacilli bacterium]